MRKALLALWVGLLGFVGLTGVASATEPALDAEAEITGAVNGGIADIAPIMVALFGAVLVIAVLAWGLTKGYRAIKNGGKLSF